MHIGLIGGIGPAATDFYHRGLIAAARTRRTSRSSSPSPTPTCAMMSRNLSEKRPDRQAEIFARLVGRLKGGGCGGRGRDVDGRPFPASRSWRRSRRCR